MESTAPWRLLRMGANSSAFNMAADAVLLRGQATSPQPVLRHYRWSRRVLSFGYFQEIPELVDPDACAASQIELIRRPTGGGVVVHDNSLTFSIIVPAGEGPIPSSEDDAYRRIGEIAVDAFARIGVASRTASTSPPDDDALPNWCMLHAVRNDVLCGDRKVAGVARRAIRSGALYQAYVFIDAPSDELLTVAPRVAIAQQVPKLSASLSGTAGRSVTWDEVADSVSAACADVLGVRFETSELTQEERTNTEAAVEQAYGRTNWLMGDRMTRRALRRGLEAPYLST